MAAQYVDVEPLWRDYFGKPSDWWDNRNSKTHSKHADFKHKKTKERLWINGLHTPFWVQEQLRKLHFIAELKDCAQEKDLCKGIRIHANICKTRPVGSDIELGNTLITMYAKCGAMERAKEVLNELPTCTIVSWNALISGYTYGGDGHEALRCFDCMHHQGFAPDSVSFICALKACSMIGAVSKGQEIHSEVVRLGLLERDTFVGNGLVNMYIKFGTLAKAQEVFYGLPVWDIVSWSTLIAGYAQWGDGHEALKCFKQMQDQGLSPNTVIFTCLLKACSNMESAERGEELHAEIVRQGLFGRDVVLGNALLCMYVKSGELVRAQEVFEVLHVRDIFSWNVLIAGYIQHGQNFEALICFDCMQEKGISPDAITFTCIVTACQKVGTVGKGKEIHLEIVRQGLLNKDIALGNALVDMFAKCGAVSEAQEVFDEIRHHSIVTWSALIAGYAQVGKFEHAFNSFWRMLEECVQPDLIIWTVLLNACSHAGLVDEGQLYYELMGIAYGIIPTLEHHTCMVDLYGRAGHLNRALCLMKMSPWQDSCPLWSALLSACQRSRNVILGKLAFDQAVHLGGVDDAVYVCMSNIYAAAGMLEEAEKIEAMRVRKRVQWFAFGE